MSQNTKTTIESILISIIALVLSELIQKEELALTIESHGRQELLEGFNNMQCVGWLTNIYPIILHITPDIGLIKLAENIKVKLQEVPSKGIGYGILKYLCKHNLVEEPDIFFQYLGEIDAKKNEFKSFRISNLSIPNQIGKEMHSEFNLIITIAIVQNSIQISCSYNDRLYKKEFIGQFLNRCKHYIIDKASKSNHDFDEIYAVNDSVLKDELEEILELLQ